MKLNKLLLTTSLVPIAVVPAMATSCNKNTEIDDLHLMVVCDGSYCPKACYDEKTHEPILQKYSKGLHTFVIEQVDSTIPIFEFWFEIMREEWTISKTNFKVMWNEQGIEEKDISDWWEPELTNNYFCLKDGKEKISKGKISFTIEVLEDIEAWPGADSD